MTLVRFQFQLDAKNSSEKAALAELQEWKALIDGGQKEFCQLKQKKMFLAGLYLQKVLPDLVEKLAQNLSSAGLEEFNYFYKANSPALNQDSANEQQNEVLKALQTLQESLNSQFSSIGIPNATIPESAIATDPVVQIKTESPAEEVVSLEVVDTPEVSLTNKLKLVSEIKAKRVF